MQQNPSTPNAGKENKNHERRDAILRSIKSILLDNLGTKLLAVFIAVALWAGLITQDPTLTREKQFTDVAVNVIGSDTMKRNGYIVLEDMNEVLEDVTLRVSVPQGQYTKAAADNYSVRIDLSRIAGAGEQELKILTTNSTTYGTVTEIDPPTVTLTVDEYVTRYRIPVTMVIEGQPPEGFYAAAPSSDPPMIAVSGPKTLVERIASAQVVVEQSNLPTREGSVLRALPFALVDDSGAVIQSDMIQVTNESVLLDSIIVEQTMYSQRTVVLSDLGLVTGQPAEGYEVKGVYISPGSVTVAGRGSIINELNLLYADGNVNVSGLKESVNKSLRVRQPSTVKHVSTDTVTVAVEIGPITTTRAYEAEVELVGLDGRLREAGGTRTATVYLTGGQPWLDSLSVMDISLTCDLSAITVPGTYTLPLTCSVKGDEGQVYTCEISPANLVATVIER